MNPVMQPQAHHSLSFPNSHNSSGDCTKLKKICLPFMKIIKHHVSLVILAVPH